MFLPCCVITTESIFKSVIFKGIHLGINNYLDDESWPFFYISDDYT